MYTFSDKYNYVAKEFLTIDRVDAGSGRGKSPLFDFGIFLLRMGYFLKKYIYRDLCVKLETSSYQSVYNGRRWSSHQNVLDN